MTKESLPWAKELLGIPLKELVIKKIILKIKSKVGDDSWVGNRQNLLWTLRKTYKERLLVANWAQN